MGKMNVGKRYILTRGDKYIAVNYITGEFNFACSLKNYSNEIEFFIANVLPEIADSWELEELYEEEDTPTMHTKEGDGYE